MSNKWDALDGIFAKPQVEEPSKWDTFNNLFDNTVLPEVKPSFLENVARAAGSGALKMAGNLAHSVPLMLSQIFDTDVRVWNYQKKLLSPDTPDVELSYQDIANHPLNPGNYAEQAGQFLNQTAQNIAPKVEFDEGIAASLLHGNTGQGLEQLSYALAENAPQFALAAATTALGVPQASLSVLGASTAGGAYADLQGSGMDAQAIRDNAFLKGAVETGMEKYFTIPLLEKAMESPTVRGQVQQGAMSVLKNTGLGFLQEGGSELATQVGQNAIDVMTGNPDAPGVMDGAMDAMLVGGVMGGSTGLVGDISKRVRGRKSDGSSEVEEQNVEQKVNVSVETLKNQVDGQGVGKVGGDAVKGNSEVKGIENGGEADAVKAQSKGTEKTGGEVEGLKGQSAEGAEQSASTEVKSPESGLQASIPEGQKGTVGSSQSAEKQPWEMTEEEYEEYRKTILPHKIDFVPATESKLGKNFYGRKASVYRAITEGKDVPDAVLDEFPDLKGLIQKSSQSNESPESEPLKMEERTHENVGNRKVKAYQYEHPEVKEYVQTEAAILQAELKDSIKGMRFPIKDGTGQIVDWKGQKKFVSDSIQRIQDVTGATYQQIDEALQRIIEDDGRENVALAKRIELIIDDNLTKGYKAFAGFDIPPNQDYIRAKQKIEGQGVKVTAENVNDAQTNDVAVDVVGELSSEDSADKVLDEQMDSTDPTTVFADKGGYADRSFYGTRKHSQIELPEIVEIVNRLNEGKYPHIKEKISRRGVLGRLAIKGGSGQIDLRADIFLGQSIDFAEVTPRNVKGTKEALERKYADQDNIVIRTKHIKQKGKYEITVYRKDPTIAAKVLSHEIGHLIDWLPDKDMARGNILGRIATLKKHLKQSIDELPQIEGRQSTLIEGKGTKKDAVPQITRDQVMAELKNLSMKWKPFDSAKNPEYTKYRFSSPELYADAISVLFNEPSLLQGEAPTFFKAFLQYLDRKPLVKAVYKDIQNRLTDTDAINEKRLDKIQHMFTRDAEIRNKLHQEKKANVEDVVDSVMRWLVDKDHAILKIVRSLEKQGGLAQDVALNARYALEESKYISSEIENYLYEIGENILNHIKSANLTVDDLGTFMFLERVQNERDEMANPLGQTKLTAAQTLEAYKNKVGEERFEMVKNAVGKYKEFRGRLVLERVEEAGMYSPEMLDMMRSNEHYARFSVLNYLENRMGKGETAKIYKQIGTLSEISNPFVATVLQDISMLRAAKINEAKTATLIMLSQLGKDVIEKAETIYSLDRKAMVPKEPTDPKKGLITILVDGKLQWYYVSKNIAESFEYQPFESTKLAQVWSLINQPLRELLVSKNPYWMIRNVIRDFKATVKNIPEVRLRDTPTLMKKYKEAYREAWRTVFKGERSQDVSEMMKGWMLIPERVYSAREKNFDNEIERLVEEFELDPQAHREGKQAIRRVYDYLNKLGRVSEIGGKIAGYKYLKEFSRRSQREIAHIVRTRVGTPDYKRQGSLQAITNNIFMFSNVNKEGKRSSLEAFREDKGAYVWKTVAMNMLPKLILAGALAGGSEVLKKIIEGVSEYDKRNYNVIPLGLNKNGESVYLRIPQDYEGQFFGALAWDLATGKILGKGGVLDVVAEQNPYQVNPYIQVGQDIFQYYVRGLNPYDSYRGRQVISYGVYKKGGFEASKELWRHEWKQLGLSVIYNPNGSFEYSETGFEKLLQIFPFSLLGTFLKVSDYGHQEKANREKK